MKTKVTQKKQTQKKPWYRKKRFIHCVCIVLCPEFDSFEIETLTNLDKI